MIIDGRALAQAIMAAMAEQINEQGWSPRLTVFTCAPNFETRKFLSLKANQAKRAGIELTVIELPETSSLEDVAAAVEAATATSDGLIIQFPFPQLATADLIPLIPASHDVDVMQYQGSLDDLLPPVVGAIETISATYQVDWVGKSVVVVGQGRLVGRPAAAYAAAKGGLVTTLYKDNFDLALVRAADIIILGAGVPGLLKPDWVKAGVVVFDAGTSEEGGMLVGDAEATVATKASLFTPVPGGIGPLTVAILLKNTLDLARQHRK